MRITVTLDETLLAKAQALIGISGRSALLRDALHVLVQRESAARLACLGGTEPKLGVTKRRRQNLR